MTSQRNLEVKKTVTRSVEFHMLSAEVKPEEDKNTKLFSQMIAGNETGEVNQNPLEVKIGNSSVAASDRISTSEEKSNYETIRHQCIIYLLECLLSRKKEGSSRFEQMLNELKEASGQTQAVYMESKPLSVYGFTENVKTYYSEKEETSFQADGVVRTGDGREIHFQMEVGMSRSFQSYMEEKHDVPTFTDPLVISLNGEIPSLSDQKFMFDLDGDHNLDCISMLETGSGFLALDRNGDGVINDGSELFGTKSGDGFRDLSQYDEDGNGWIDENDSIFEKLMIWTKDENGNDLLYGLKEAGVGALCLQKAETDFALKSVKNNALNGQIRSTGIFLYENGNAGIMQHLDLAT